MPTRRFLAIPFVVVCSLASFAQDEGEKPTVELPDKVMSQVVRRIVQWYFKPANQPRTIHFSENGIKAAWLPKIRNIEFVLLNDKYSNEREKGVYFFEQVEREGKTYSINFGFGHPNCDATGDPWKFRVIGNAVKLWQFRGGWGKGCGESGGPVAVRGLKVGELSPNEQDSPLGLGTRLYYSFLPKCKTASYARLITAR